MAVNLFDHPYAATVTDFDDSDEEKNSGSEITFKDSPRKVLVQESKGGTLNILNEIIQNQDFSCLNKSAGDSAKENGFHIESEASSSDEMEVDKSNTDRKDEESPEKKDKNIGCETKSAKDNSKLDDVDFEENRSNDAADTNTSGSKEKLETSDTEASKVLDIFRGITDVFDAKEKEHRSEATDIQDKDNENKSSGGSQDGNKDNVGTSKQEAQETEAADTNKKFEEKEPEVASECEKGSEEMDTSANDTAEFDVETDSADEADLDNSLDNVTELTSEIKASANNGIIVSVLKKKRKRRGKRKNTCWSRPSPYKIRRMSSGSPRKVAIAVTASEPKSEAMDADVTKGNDENRNEDEIAEDAGTQTPLEDIEKYEETTAQNKEEYTSQSDDPEGIERLNRRRSRTPNYKEGYAFGDEAFKDLDIIDIADSEKAFHRKKGLLFNRGRKASPSQIKPLTAEEAERYTEPFKQGWKRELVFRGAYTESSVKTQADTYYFPPTGPKLRSMVQITEWINSHQTTLTQDNFTFMRRAIGAEGEMVRNAAQSRGKPPLDATIRKRKPKFYRDDHVHDDNDGQYDKPEIVIERDLDDFLAPIMSAATTAVSESSPKREVRRGPGRPPKEKVQVPETIVISKDVSKIPNLDELKTDKVETMQPSNEAVIISPSKKKEHKATARKSTTQRVFKKPLSISGIENLCSLACPGMEGMPPMLQCIVCMCLFHNECVNFYVQDEDFVCLRCQNHPPPSAGRPASTIVDGNIMKVNIPNMISNMNQINTSLPSSVQNLVRVYPNGNTSTSANSPVLGLFQTGNQVRPSTPPNTILPLYKALAMAANSPKPPPSRVGEQYNYPVLLTKNTSALNSSSSPSGSKSPFILYPPLSMKSQKVSLPSSITSKSPVLADMINSKSSSDMPETKPVIKQEPVDDSYDASLKGSAGKNSPKGINNSKASMEALDSLKNVLTTRLGSPTSIFQDIRSKLPIPNVNASSGPLPTVLPVPQPLRFLNTINPNIPNMNSPLTLSQTINQSRMAFTLTSPPQNQFLSNQEYKIVPIGPPMPLSKLQSQIPILQTKNFLPVTSAAVRQPVEVPPPIAKKPENPLLTASVSITTQEEAGMAGNSVPLVVNAKHVSPMNGQLLTLPPPVVKKLSLNKPLALKINNRQIVVPPSGFFQSSEGLKVFLPPNTFPTADDNGDEVSASSEKVQEEKSVAESKSSSEHESSKSLKSAKTDSQKKDESNVRSDKINIPEEVRSEKTTDITKNKFYRKCCLIQRLYGGYDCMFHIFKFLDLKDLVRMNQVCKTWKRISMLPDLWTSVSFSGTKVSDWGKALKYINRREVQFVNLKGLSHFEEPNRTWHQLVSSLHELQMMKKISFGLVPAAVLQSVAGKLTQLDSFMAESISDFTDDSMWNVPTKLDVGNFSCMSGLTELKLRGTGGLSLPSFSFGCGFSDLGKLKNLHTLHLTSLRNLDGADFNFISNFTNLKELALGDCEKWTHETYSHLEKLTSLRKLRLENGGKIPDIGLGLALSQLTELDTLDLQKYTIAYTFGNHISSLTKLQHLKIFPVNMHYMGEVNTNTLHTVENLKQLKTLEWTIENTNISSIIISHSETMEVDQSNDCMQHWIPFQTDVAESGKNSASQYISMPELKEKLRKLLPDTKVKVCSAQSEKKLT